MDLIDDRGRLFGAVNVIDAFVVLMVVSVLAAGIGFVLSEQSEGTAGAGTPTPTQTPTPEPDFATRYATIDLGTQPSYLAALISEGDTIRTGDGGELSVTDVYVGPADGQRAAVVVRAKIRGQGSNASSIVFGGSQLRPGTTLPLSTAEYAVEGTITNVDRDEPSLGAAGTPLLLETTLPASVAERIDTGDAFRLSNRTVATVESVRTVPTADPATQRVFLGVTVRTIRNSQDRFFGTHPVTLDGTLPIRTANYSVSGRVLRLGTHSLPGRPAHVTARIEVANVSRELADNLRVGMTETSRGTTLARITDTRVEPATVVQRDRDGAVYASEHPTKRDVTLTVSLRVHETDTGLLFHGRPLQEGVRLVLDFRTIRVRGTVVDIEG